ncbi:S9 family peptidase [soil metagenome]
MLRAWPLALLIVPTLAGAQEAAKGERLEDSPRYARYQQGQQDRQGAFKSGALLVRWADDSKSFTFNRDGKWIRYDVGARKETETTEPSSDNRGSRNRRPPARGRQFSEVFSADGKLKAFERDRNVWVSDADGKNERALTTDGDAAKRTKYGIASWVYGEELEVREAMWFNPSGNKLAYYGFDESPVKDYFLAMDQNGFQDALDTEAYPKAGAPNPKVSLWVRSLDMDKPIRVDTAFGDASLGEYVYDVRWKEDGSVLLFNRTNRKQNKMQLCSADPGTGTCRVVAEEFQPQSWAENHPYTQWLDGGKKLLWMSERNGYRNLYLDGKTVTSGQTDIDNVVRVDEKKGLVWFTASGMGNPYLTQFHRARLDGKEDRQLTTDNLGHNVNLSPDGRFFVDVRQSWNVAPKTVLCDEKGKDIAVLGESDTAKMDSLGLKPTELFQFTAADGKTPLYGTVQFPSDFDPSKKYPMLLSIYAGPESGGPNVRFTLPSPLTELGFLVVNIAGRGTTGRGKVFRDAIYEKLGVVEIDDQAAGIQELAKRPYVDGKRVGIYGTSYGGYSTVLALLRHPETFAVGCASSSVTDWRNYDTIYTERYMGLPTADDNLAGYDAGSGVKLAKNLQGRLLIYFGSADNNVHPANTYQLVTALEKAGIRYDMQVGPDREHTQMNSRTMWEYFIRYLKP